MTVTMSINGRAEIWDDPAADWGAYDAVVVRSVWDYLDRRADGSYGNAIEAFDAISCVDEQRTTDPAAIADGARRRTAAARTV